MQQDQRQHLRKVFWNGAEYVSQAISVQQEPPVKYHVHRGHTALRIMVNQKANVNYVILVITAMAQEGQTFLESVILGIFANVELASQNPTMTLLVVSAQGDTSVQLGGSQKIVAQVFMLQ